MSDPNELRHEHWLIERNAERDGWEAVATEIIRLDAEHVEPKPSDEAVETKIAEVGSFISRVLAHIDEPTVFQSRSEDYLHFSTVIPDQETPFSFGSKVPAIYLESTSKQVGDTGYWPMPGGRDIVARIGNENTTLDMWMGAGARSEYTHIPFFGDQVAENIAVGGEEIAELFTELRSDNDMYNGRLFGALMHIAWLADDFDAKIPVVSDFAPQAEKSLTRLHLDMLAAEGIAHVSLHGITSINNTIIRLKDEAATNELLYKKVEQISREVPIPRLANGPPIGIDSGLQSTVAALENVKKQFHKFSKIEKEEQRGRDRQRKLVNALMGISG